MMLHEGGGRRFGAIKVRSQHNYAHAHLISGTTVSPKGQRAEILL